jgi:two-component system LytT family response regulator
MRVLIADDEPIVRRGLRLRLAAQPDVEIVGEAANGRETVSAIRALGPDAVFLDVQMPAGDGFWVVRQVGPERMPPVVFVTAYDEYAVSAFAVNAVDYVLKPFDAERLRASLERLRSRLSSRDSAEREARLRELLEAHDRARTGEERLAIRSAGRVDLVRVDEIDWVEAADNYAVLHCGAKTHMLLLTLNRLAKRLPPARFLRIHRGRIVNLSRIRRMRPLEHGEYELVLVDGTRLRSSRRHKAALRRLADRP